MELVVILLSAWLIFVIAAMCLCTLRHVAFTCSRLLRRQRPSFGDAYDEELPSVTVLMPMHNEAKVAAYALDAVLASDYPAQRLEIIPIDDHSDDATAEILASYAARDPRVRPIAVLNGNRRGKANALNAALPHATSEIVLVFDADYTPGKGLIRRLAMAFADPQVGAVMGRVVPRNTNRSLVTRLLSMERAGGYQVDQQARYNMNLMPQYGGTVGGFRRRVLAEIGGFDPLGLAEDTELTVNLYERGWKIAYDNRAECYEEVPETWAARFTQLRRWSRGHNRVLFGHLVRVLFAGKLTLWQRADAAFLLLSYLIPPLIVSGWIAEFMLFAMGRMPAAAGIAIAVAVVLYNAFGNFAPAYEVAVAEMLDGHSARLRLLPLLLFAFPFNAWTITTGFIDTIGDTLKSRATEWEKTARTGAGVR